MANILSVPERIRLFKEINRVHRKMYGWKLLYWPAWGKVSYIDIDRDARATSNDWIPMSTDEIQDYYFHDTHNRDLTLLSGLFAWESFYFYHLNPYKFDDYYHPSGAKAFESCKLTKEDFVSDSSGKRIRPDIDHPVRCSEYLIEVQQRKDDGKIWISSSWQYRPECYGPANLHDEAIIAAITKQVEGDNNPSESIKERYWKSKELDRDHFLILLDRYFKGDRLRGRHWEGGYAFAASRAWKIKNGEQLDEALKAEDRHFKKVLEQYFRWLKSKVIILHEEEEIALKEMFSHSYSEFPRSQAIDLCKKLVEEDKANPSDVYLWWGGEPNRDAYYALLTLFFEVDHEDIGTSRFDEKISRNLRTIINMSEYSYREYEPSVWKAIFS